MLKTTGLAVVLAVAVYGSHYIQWELTGPESTTQVSVATYY